jgi:hypothetical protein
MERKGVEREEQKEQKERKQRGASSQACSQRARQGRATQHQAGAQGARGGARPTTEQHTQAHTWQHHACTNSPKQPRAASYHSFLLLPCLPGLPGDPGGEEQAVQHCGARQTACLSQPPCHNRHPCDAMQGGSRRSTRSRHGQVRCVGRASGFREPRDLDKSRRF